MKAAQLIENSLAQREFARGQGDGDMTENENNDDAGQQRAATERLAWARQQLAVAAAEFQKALSAVRDPARRRELTSTYVELLKKTLANAQRGVDRYSRNRRTSTPDDMPAGDAAPVEQDAIRQ